MQTTSHPTWIEIDLAQFKKNISLIKKFVFPAKFCLPVKANAYGHGLCPIGKAAEEVGVDYLAVAHLKEGIELRNAGVTIPILVLGAIHEEQIDDLIHYDLEFTISSKFKADLVASVCKQKGVQCKVHIEVDTGMQRTGVRPLTAVDLFSHLLSFGCFNIKGIYSHLATGDIPNDPHAEKQIEDFTSLVSGDPFEGDPILKHLANSGGVLFYPNSHMDMVRPSLLCFGYKPENIPKELLEIKPCFSLKTKISYFKVVAGGQGISYNRKYITGKQTRIITIPIGYGDGLKRGLSGKATVLLRGKKYPIVGTICMDSCMVDIGDSEAYVGEEVVLIGAQGDEEITLMQLAGLCDTIPYEVLCFFNERIPRMYKDI
ncbi:MAG: alanine racemase [Chlamydiae bacterium]|nr:alanine racemase [Chlamydiota bacterium]